MRNTERKKINIDFNFEIKEITDLNTSFSLARVAIAYAGRNRNMSTISKSAFELALPTLKNVPVVGRYDEELDRFGGHDIKVVTTKDNNIKVVTATTPFGVVHESANQYWEDVVEANGEVRSYLYTDIILWKRQYGYEHLVAKKSIGQSMEISFDTYVIDQDGYYVIDNFEFTALCLISCEPCFESASVQLFNKKEVEDYSSQFSQMLFELKDLAKEQSINLDFSIKNTNEEGGNKNMTLEKMNEILLEYNTKLEDLDFEYDENTSEEDFKIKLDEFKKRKKCTLAETYAATYQQKRNALSNACDHVIIRDGDNNIISNTYYWVSDFNDEFVYVERSVWTDDNSENTVGRFAYVFDDATQVATLTSEFEQMVVTWLTLAENEQLEKSRNTFYELQTEFDDYKSKYTTPDVEVEELRTFKVDTLNEQRTIDETELFNKFDEKLNSDTEYETLKANCKDLSLNEISDKCFSILGKKLASFSVVKPKTSLKVPISILDDGADNDSTKPYGDVYEKYLNK